MTYGQLQADCLYTGISSGPNARCRVWEAFTFLLCLVRRFPVPHFRFPHFQHPGASGIGLRLVTSGDTVMRLVRVSVGRAKSVH